MSSYQNKLRVARVYAQAAEEREDNSPEEAIVYYRKALKQCAQALGNCTNDGDSRIVREQAGNYKMRIKFLEKPPKKKEDRYREKAGDDKGPKERLELTQPKTTFDDVGGMEELKEEMELAIISPLEDPECYQGFMKNKFMGVLLYGPPGCGKTYMGKSVAGEAKKKTGMDVSFIYARSSDILDSWVGNSEKNLRAAFETAAEEEPSILFFDELDALGKSRSGKSVYADRLVNEFLTDFDLLEGKQVLVLGATNNPWDVDSALIRSGRMGTKILVGPPDREARIEIYKYHSQGRKLAKNVDFVELAELTNGYVASDIEQVCEKAARLAWKEARSNPKRTIEQDDYVTAISKVNSSLDDWCIQAKNQLKKPDIQSLYPGLKKIVEDVKARKVA